MHESPINGMEFSIPSLQVQPDSNRTNVIGNIKIMTISKFTKCYFQYTFGYVYYVMMTIDLY